MKHSPKVAQILIHNVSCTNFAGILKHNVMQRALNYFPSGGTKLRKKGNKKRAFWWKNKLAEENGQNERHFWWRRANSPSLKTKLLLEGRKYKYRGNNTLLELKLGILYLTKSLPKVVNIFVKIAKYISWLCSEGNIGGPISRNNQWQVDC